MNASAGGGRLPRLLCIMGSGETTPTMVSVHADLLSRLGPRPIPAVLLDTPFGFQENAADISERTVAYFRDRVGFPITVASFRNREWATALEYETMLARVAEARYVFAGPGSPSYALRQWTGTAVPDLLAAKLRDGGCVTLASAAAVGLGVCSLPVYEVYKVGEAPRWLDGLDLLSATGLRAAVVPHYNNAEGGTHDTRYCYMGERRLRILEDLLPDGVDILGVDEHTAAIFDIDAGTVSIRGRGVVTWRRHGVSQRFENGTTIPISDLAAQHRGCRRCACRAGRRGRCRVGIWRSPPRACHPFSKRSPGSPMPPTSALAVARRRRCGGCRARDRLADPRVGGRYARFGRAGSCARDAAALRGAPRRPCTQRRPAIRATLVGPVVEQILDLRVQMRAAGEYALADKLRDALVDAGIEVHDTPAGSTWEFAAAAKA